MITFATLGGTDPPFLTTWLMDCTTMSLVNQFEFKQITKNWRRFGKSELPQQAQDFKGYF